MTTTLENSKTNNNLFNYQNLKQKMQKILNSTWSMVALSVLIVLFWAINFAYVSLGFMLLFEIAVFIFCPENPKAFILPLISFTYAITGFSGAVTWAFYGSFIFLFLVTVISYILIQKIKYKKELKKGKMFWAFVISGIGNILGGIVGFFSVLEFFIVLVFCFLVYAIYWFVLNFVKDFNSFFAKCLIFLTLIISFELIIAYLRFDNILQAMQLKLVRVGTGEINGAAIFMLGGVCSCFYLARNSKYDYLFVLLAFVLDVFIFFTFSRIAVLICAVISIAYFFITFKNSQNKKILLIGLGVLVACLIVFVALFYKKLVDVLAFYINQGIGGNGREVLWKWCFDEFKNNLIFGIGFVTRNTQAITQLNGYGLVDLGGGVSLVNCHNFFLHFLTCTGVVGFILNIPFYVKKYIITFKNFNHTKLFCLMNFICLFISSLFDPSPNISIFNIIIALFLIAIAEIDNNEEILLPIVNKKYIEKSNNEGNNNVENSEEKPLNKKNEQNKKLDNKENKNKDKKLKKNKNKKEEKFFTEEEDETPTKKQNKQVENDSQSEKTETEVLLKNLLQKLRNAS